MKKCSNCKTEKTLDEFSNNKKAKDGLQNYCNPCLRHVNALKRIETKKFLNKIKGDRSQKDKAILWAINDDKNIQLFLSNIMFNGDCMEWTGLEYHNNYGQFSVKLPQCAAVPVKAHRFAYALHYKTLPNGISGGAKDIMVIDHMCHNRKCVNPLHLQVLTKSENSKKRVKSNG